MLRFIHGWFHVLPVFLEIYIGFISDRLDGDSLVSLLSHGSRLSNIPNLIPNWHHLLRSDPLCEVKWSYTTSFEATLPAFMSTSNFQSQRIVFLTLIDFADYNFLIVKFHRNMWTYMWYDSSNKQLNFGMYFIDYCSYWQINY